jgi:hypothetical protein
VNSLPLLEQQLAYRRGDTAEALGFLLLKPGHTPEDIDFVQAGLAEHDLRVLQEDEVRLSPADALALYHRLFSFRPNDSTFGLGWKDHHLLHITSGLSHYVVARGIDAVTYCDEIKQQLRSERGKLGAPGEQMTTEEFLERCVRNVIHNAEDEDIETTLWLVETWGRQ